MNKKVSLVIIQNPTREFDLSTYVISKDGKIQPTTHTILSDPNSKLEYTPIDYYFVDDQPIQPNNQYISYVPEPNVKTHTEIDHVLIKGMFKKGERRVFLNKNDVRYVYNQEDKQLYPFGPWHLNEIIDKGFTCWVKERNNDCDGNTCLNCNCYEFVEEKFLPEKIDNKFVIVI
jgi:hypothetical protein